MEIVNGTSKDNSPVISKGSSIHKVPEGKMIKISLTMTDDIIEDVRITGDFFAHPEDSIEQIEKNLKGSRYPDIPKKIYDLITSQKIQLVGMDKDDITHAIKLAIENMKR